MYAGYRRVWVGGGFAIGVIGAFMLLVFDLKKPSIKEVSKYMYDLEVSIGVSLKSGCCFHDIQSERGEKVRMYIEVGRYIVLPSSSS